MRSPTNDVSNISRIIAQGMGMDKDAIDGLRIGAILHDLGLMFIPTEILHKPGKLTPAEYETVKQHPVHAFQMLRTIDFPWPVARMVLQHQERLDGSGYPGGIKGDDIVMEARIIAVADVIESMTSDRHWRKALTIEVALDEIKASRGIKYDPSVVDACVDIYTNRPEILDNSKYPRGK